MSSAYIEFHVEDISLRNVQKNDCSWSGEPLYLSVVTYSPEAGGTVKLLNKNGLLLEVDDKIGTEIPEKPGIRVLSSVWHPTINVLAVGWENGDLGCYHISAMRNKWVYASPDEEYSNLGAINHLVWIGHHGNELVTIDSTNLLIIWAFDHMSAQLQSRASHQLNDDITDTASAFVDGEAGMYLCSSSGLVYRLTSHSAHVIDVIQLDQPIKRLMYFNKRSRLIVITESLVLHQYAISSDEFMEVAKVKLSGANRILGSETISLKLIDEDQGLIAICVTGERVIRLWQLENGQSASVIVAESADSHWAGVTTVDYNNGILSAGTSNSNVIIWKRQSGLEFPRSSQVAIKGSVSSLAVNRRGQIAVTTANNELYLLENQSMCATSGGGIAVAQVGAKRLRFFWMGVEPERTFELDVHLPVRSLYIDSEGKCVAINLTGSKETHFYKIGQSSVVAFKEQQLEMNGERLFAMQKFMVYYVHSTIKDTKIFLSLVAFDLQTDNQTIEPITLESDLLPAATDDSLNVTLLDLNGGHLLVLFANGSRYYYLTCDINGPSMKLQMPLTALMTNGETIRSARINCIGTLISICDPYQIFVLQSGESRPFEHACIQLKEPIQVLWATNEARLFAFKDTFITSIIMCAETMDGHIVTRQYDQLEAKQDSQLLGFKVPDLFFLESGDFFTITNQTLSEFKGLSVQTIKIMIDFLTTPSLDLNQMIKTINRMGEDNAKLWTNLARISVKCRDIKMGLYCITKLRNARVANDVKKELYATNDELCGLAVLAINLQLYSEAEELLKESGNKLALSKYYQNQNEWQKALECVDKVNLKTVYYNYAKYLENEEGNIAEAIKFYEKSNTNVFEVPRMLFEKEESPEVLKRYCLGSKGQRDPQLIRWWGQYCESQENIDEALEAYKKSNDYYHLVRLLCCTGDSEQAKAVVNGDLASDSQSRGSRDAGLLYLGRHLESTNPNESISYYLSCGAIKHALRVCRNNGLLNELIKITVNHGTKADAKELINKYMDYAEEAGVSKETVVQLHHKCGNISKAIEYGIQFRTWTQLREILRDEMNQDGKETEQTEQRPPVVTEQNLELALQALRDDADIIDIVIDMLLLSKSSRLNLLENLLVEFNVEINEKLIDKVEKVVIRSAAGPNHKLAQSLAEMALQQGKYVIAAKLFNSLGDRTGSIKALIRNGQIDKVISYANIARDKAVYKIAANYLQTVNYEQSNVIATFYKKAGAKQELERFLSQQPS